MNPTIPNSGVLLLGIKADMLKNTLTSYKM